MPHCIAIHDYMAVNSDFCNYGCLSKHRKLLWFEYSTVKLLKALLLCIYTYQSCTSYCVNVIHQSLNRAILLGRA